MKTFIIPLALILTCTVASIARAEADVGASVDVDGSASLGLEVGVDHSVQHGMLVDLMLRGIFSTKDNITAGGRFGLSATDKLALLALPIDGFIRADLGGAYVEGLIGPWFLTRARDFQSHIALGAGVEVGGLTVGAELGWLNPAPMLGARAAFAF